MNWITNKMLCSYLAIVLIRTTAVVRGCDPYPPCGIVAKGLKFTDTPGIVHVVLGKYADCGEEMDFQTASNELDASSIEIDTETGAIRTQSDVPWAAVSTSVSDDGLGALPTVDQSGYSIRFGTTPASIIVTGRKFQRKKLVFHLPGLVAPDDPNDIVSFYSDTLQRLFFLYEKQQDGSLFRAVPTSIASCSISDGSCVTTDTTLDLCVNTGALRFRGVRVYDDLRLVGLPGCSSCGGYAYYSFNRRTLVRSVEMLNNVFSITGVDSRTGVAYSVDGGRRGGGGSGVLRIKKKTRSATRIRKSILKKSFTVDDDRARAVVRKSWD